ncbi:MAG TPA: sugar ABC transporter permease [Bacillales bacterium]|nr:sugar ABC transporter permease [Bacillales bacterium]
MQTGKQTPAEAEQSHSTSRPSERPWMKVLLTVLVLAVNFIFHYGVFSLLKQNDISPVWLTIVAVVWGSVGIFTIYLSLNWVLSLYPESVKKKIQPFVFISPAVFILGWLLFIPALRTLVMSFFGPNGDVFVGLKNYLAIFTQREMLITLRNTLMWVVFGTFFSVAFGLLIAVLAERSSFEKIAKSIIFMPMVISFVGAGVVWKFIYAYEPGDHQIGLLNAVVQAFGGEPQAWLSLVQPWNNLFLIAIMIWMQTGFAMVILSASIKGVPNELLEAARIDGASEIRIFFKIIVPYIKTTLAAVTTTIVIFSLKIFDIVIVMTGGQYGTGVIATKFYREFFTYDNQGYGSALAILLLLFVIPVIWINASRFKKEEGF